jgi:hypothetical protein
VKGVEIIDVTLPAAPSDQAAGHVLEAWPH